MLVIISDLHLTDGTTSDNLHPGAFRIFADRLRYLAVRGSWRADGSYRPVDCVDLVLLGDVLDLTHSSRWQSQSAKPWDDPRSLALQKGVFGIVDAALEQNSESIGVLRSLVDQAALRVPPMNRMGQPVYNVPPQPVPVRIHYMVGNHDWMLGLPGQNFDALRQKVATHLGLAQAAFPHDPAENPALMEVMRRHRVMARHGDIFDPLNFNEDRNASSLGDAISIQLIGRFAGQVRALMGNQAPPALLAGLSEIDNIRPLLMTPIWLEGLLERTCPNPAMRKAVKQLWDRLADELLQMKMVQERDTWSSFDLVNGLERALKFNKHMSGGWSSKVAAWMQSLRGAKSESYYEHALSEPDFRNRRAQHLVYGHTHHAEALPLDASYADGFVLSQTYFNTGTWRRVHRVTLMTPDSREFIPSESMNISAFYTGDERGGRPFETWSGCLGMELQFEQRRSNPQATSAPATVSQPAPAYSAPPLSAPHFAASRVGNGTQV